MLVFETLMSGRADRQSIINRIRHRNGNWIWVEAHFRTLRHPETGAITGIIGALRDISVRKAVEDELAEANRRLKALAGQDGLTGLANRRAFDEALAKEHRRTKREKKALSLIMIDVDRFKLFNDCYGHPAGDDCLRRVAAAIAETARRPGDVAARYGGEEFAVLLPDTDEAGAEVIAARILEAVCGLKIRHDGNINGLVTISAGVACSCPGRIHGRPETLIQTADRALYCAKDNGRNAVIRASAMESSPGAGHGEPPPATAGHLTPPLSSRFYRRLSGHRRAQPGIEIGWPGPTRRSKSMLDIGRAADCVSADLRLSTDRAGRSICASKPILENKTKINKNENKEWWRLEWTRSR